VEGLHEWERHAPMNRRDVLHIVVASLVLAAAVGWALWLVSEPAPPFGWFQP
jgi:hypothetical protein